MIIWVFFQAGSGGDGFANLLEQSSNAIALDENKQWRIHRYVDSQVKFWAPNLQNNRTRNNTVEQLNKQQIDIANSNNQFLIITSHDVELKNTFQKNILANDKHIKILLKSSNSKECLTTAMLKNLVEFNQSFNVQKTDNKKIILSNFDVNLDTIPDTWEDIKKLVENLGLHLSKEDFIYYKKIVSGELLHTTPGIEYYKSFIDVDNTTKYIKLN